MKKDSKRFEEGSNALVYKPKAGVAHLHAENLYDAKNFLMKQMDAKNVGIVHGITVTMNHTPSVTVMIRGKNLFKFIQSELNERESYRSKKSFSSMVKAQPGKTSYAELIVYCPGTRRFLIGTTPSGATLGFPATVVLSYEEPASVALKSLSTLSGSEITEKHVKHFNTISTGDENKHYCYLLISKSEFQPKTVGKGLVWLRHDVDKLNSVTKLLFNTDPTLKKIIDNETSPEKIDFSQIVEDMVD